VQRQGEGAAKGPAQHLGVWGGGPQATTNHPPSFPGSPKAPRIFPCCPTINMHNGAHVHDRHVLWLTSAHSVFCSSLPRGAGGPAATVSCHTAATKASSPPSGCMRCMSVSKGRAVPIASPLLVPHLSQQGRQGQPRGWARNIHGASTAVVELVDLEQQEQGERQQQQ
jgi:hypothetical protein